MYKIYIIFCILGTIFANDEESNEKYIDLLPEEEKQEFLNRIARRILEGVNSDDSPNQSHVEISEDQLNEHHDFVQNIINEESQNLKNERRKDEAGSTENKYIDLSLRVEDKDKRKNIEKMQPVTTSEPDYNLISVKPLYGEDYDGARVSFKNEKSENIEEQQDTKLLTSTSQDLPITESFTEQVDIQLSHVDNKTQSKDLKNRSTEIVDSEPIVIENTSQSNVDETITSTTTDNTSSNSNDDQVSWGSTQKVNREEDDSFNDEKLLSDISSTTEENIISSITTNSESETEASTIDTELTTKDSLTEPRLNSVIRNFSDIDNKSMFQRKDSKNVNETLTSTTNIELLTTTTLPPIPSNTNRKSGLSTKEDMREVFTRDHNYTKIKQNVTTISLKVERDSKPKLRNRIDLFESARDSPKLKYAQTPKGEYEVYEIDAKKPQFALISHNHKQLPYKQPNYVPIYNYAPENAYFKPKNKFGSNLYNDEKDSYERNLRTKTRITNNENDFKFDLPVARSRSFGHGKLNSYSINENHPSKSSISQLYALLKPHKVVNQNIHYNPYDYLDMDYNINSFNDFNLQRRDNDGSKYNRFSNLDESDYLKKIPKTNNVKDNIRAIRQLMYLQNTHGSEPDKPIIKISDLYPRNKIKRKKLDSMTTKGISVDYYFGRINSDEDLVSSMIMPSSSKIKPKLKAIPESNFERNRFLEPNSHVPFHEVKKYGQEDAHFYGFFEAIITVLKDIIMLNNKALENYSWLQTTVELQETIRSLLDTLYYLKNGDFVARKHIELLKYVAYLYEISKTDFEETLVIPKKKSKYLQFRYSKKHKNSVLPQNKRKQKFRHPLIMWKDFAKYIRNIREIESDKLNIFDKFEGFLQNLLYNLRDFHEAIKNIAGITKYRTQNWLNDLKYIYFSKASKKQIGQVVLHFGLANLLDKIKKDTNNGVEEDYKRFIKNNRRDVRKTKEDFKFVLQVLYILNLM